MNLYSWERNCVKIAARMLKVEPKNLDAYLLNRLAVIDELCRVDGGELHSRQVIATIIDEWRASL